MEEKEKEKKHSKYGEVGKCAYCEGNIIGGDTKRKYCDDECLERALGVGGSCLLCETLTKEGETFCSQECEDAHKRDCRKECFWSKECTLIDF